MNFDGLKKIRHDQAREALGDITLDEDATRLMKEAPGTVELLQRCVAAGLWVDAIRLMAVTLPQREATWWACLNARDALKDVDPPEQLALVEAAEAWVFKPSDELGQKAFAQAEKLGFDSAAAYAALAAYWSGGNMAPPEAGVEIPPGPGLTGSAAAAAVLLAAAAGDPKEAPAFYQRALGQALDIARGGSGRV